MTHMLQHTLQANCIAWLRDYFPLDTADISAVCLLPLAEAPEGGAGDMWVHFHSYATVVHVAGLEWDAQGVITQGGSSIAFIDVCGVHGVQTQQRG